MIYNYRAVSQSGEIIEGSFEGQGEYQVLEMLKSNNYIPIFIEQDIEKDVEIKIFSPKVKRRDLAIFCRQFFTMLDAGIGIVQCIDILEKQTQNKTLIKTLGVLHEDVQKGLSLSQAMEKHKNIFPSLLISMVEAGEFSGNLDTIMERMAVHYEKENQLENKIKSALVYPIVLGVISTAVVIFLLVAVMPTFVEMFESSGQELPGATQLLLKISNGLREFWYIYLFGFIGIVGAFTVFKKTDLGRTILDGSKLRIPVVKDTTVKIITARFTRTLSTLMASGMPLLQSMEIVGNIVGNKIVHDRLEIAVEEVSKGVSLSRTIVDVGIFPPMVDSMIKIGEESGALDDMLYKTADFYDDEVEVALERMTALMEPLMIVVMAVIVGFIVIAIALPMFDMASTI